jgi:dienelactone hydrolase
VDGSTLELPAGGVTLWADFMQPDAARGVVVFAHGSGSSRHSPRNQEVAAGLRDAGFATLLLDLLTEPEEWIDLRTREHRFDIGRLSERLIDAVDWLAANPSTSALPVGTFGASTGAAAALIAAARRPERVAAVVSRGGRPDLAGDELAAVRAPVLLIVGGADPQVAQFNAAAAARLPDSHTEIVPGATHLFEEPGTLARVTDLASAWFQRWLV